MFPGPMIDSGEGYAVAPGHHQAAERSAAVAGAVAKAAGASALEQVEAGESARGPKYKVELIRSENGEVVGVRFRLDLELGRMTARDYLREMERESLTKQANEEIMAKLRSMHERSLARASVSRGGSEGSGEGLFGGGGSPISASMAAAMSGGGIRGI